MAEITVTIKNLTESHKIGILQNATVKELKNEIGKKLSLPEDEFRLIFGGKILQDDEEILAKVGIQNDFTICLAIKPSTLALRNQTVLLPVNEEAQHGKKLAEALTTVVNEVPNVLLTFFNAHPGIQSVLESNRRSVKKILNIAKIDQLKISNPDLDPSQFVDKEILDIIYSNLSLSPDTSTSIMAKEMFKKWNELEREELLTWLKTPFGQNLLISPYFEQFAINFLPTNELFNAEDRQKIFKLLNENPTEGLAQIDQIRDAQKAAAAASKRKCEEIENENENVEQKSKFMKKVEASSKRFETELRALESMGFPDKIANLTALEECDGDFDDAAEKLIQSGY